MRLPALSIAWMLGVSVAWAEPQSAPIGPTLLFEELRPATKLSTNEETMLRRLIAATPQDSAERLPLLFRLAEHCRGSWLEQSQRARAAGSQLATTRSPLARARLRRALQDAEQLSKPLLVEATRLMVQIASSAKPFTRRDEALMLAADLLRLGQQPQQARALFARLIKEHPASRYIPDAYVVFGDHYFDAGQYREALQLYDRATRFPQASCAGYAYYKKAWSSIRAGDSRVALAAFTHAHQTAEATRHTALLAEIRRGIVIAYAAVGVPAKAPLFFARISKTEAPAMARQLAAIYRAAGRAADAEAISR
jgi:tetratricopeptide (TPR) repeat protein